MANKNVVEILEKNLGSLLKLTEKWLVTWKLSLGKILHVLHHMKKSDLQGLIEGTHKIVGQSKVKTINTAVVFDVNNDQYHSSNFQKVLTKADPQLRILNPDNLTMIITNGKQNCKALRKKIGEKNLAKSETQALEILSATMTDKYKDGQWNIVYYLDSTGGLCYVNCFWNGGEWYCYADRADSNAWGAGGRVFSSETLY